MMSLWKDILAALMIGMVLPGVLLNIAVMCMQKETAISDIQITIPEEKTEEPQSLPVLLRRENGRTELAQMEDYLVGVVLAEMPADFEPEALKAQSVAARTFARKAWETGGKHEDGSVCINSGCCQAYVTPEVYLEKGGTEENLNKVRRVVAATAGECLQYDGELIEATYFSCSGGSTEAAVAVWGTDYPYLQAVESPGEEDARWYMDTLTLSKEQFFSLLNQPADDGSEDRLGERVYTQGGGIASIVIGSETYTGTQLRSLLGLRSTAFDIEISVNQVRITTRGYGHRVGLSQYGADAMARNGSGYQEILAHYYPGTELVKVHP